MEATPSKLSPWIAIWIRPRSTIRKIISNGPTRVTYLLAAAGGMNWVWTFGLPWVRQLEFSQAATLFLTLTIGGILGIALMYVVGFFLRGTGQWLGGTASAADVRTAYACASVSAIPILAIAVVTDQFLNPSPGGGGSFAGEPVLARLVTFRPIAATVLGVWGAVLWWFCLAEVHRFSVWRALASLTISGLLSGSIAGCSLLALAPCAAGVWFVLAVLWSGVSQ